MNVKKGFCILHDAHKPLCFVGLGKISRQLCEYFQAELVSYEQVCEADEHWFDQRQFIAVTSDVGFKQRVVDRIVQNNGHFFSMVHGDNNISQKISIGRGTFIHCYNQSIPNESGKIGNHCLLSSHIVFGHDIEIGDFNHVSAHCYINNMITGSGCVVGVGSKIVGTLGQRLNIVSYTNLLSGSMVTKNIDVPGTYLGNRLSSTQTSLTQRIL